MSQVKGGQLAKVGDDSGNAPVSQLKYDGKTIDFYELTPYSIYSKCPAGDNSWVTHWSYNQQEENRVGIANVLASRYKDFKDGEAIHGNVLSGTHIKYAENGDMNITVTNNQNINISGNCTVTVSGNVTLNAPEATVNGNMTINGTLDVTGTTTLEGRTFLGHNHSGVQSGPSNTGGVV